MHVLDRIHIVKVHCWCHLSVNVFYREVYIFRSCNNTKSEYSGLSVSTTILFNHPLWDYKQVQHLKCQS